MKYKKRKDFIYLQRDFDANLEYNYELGAEFMMKQEKHKEAYAKKKQLAYSCEQGKEIVPVHRDSSNQDVQLFSQESIYNRDEFVPYRVEPKNQKK